MSDRKARLAALAAKAGRNKPEVVSEDPNPPGFSGDDASNNDGSNAKRGVSFRNYAPNDNSLDRQQDKDKGSPPKRYKSEEDIDKEQSAASGSAALQEALQDAQEEVALSNHIENNNNNNNNNNEEEITALAPKKVNWDLKRGIQDKIAKLERRTQKAIVDLLKERLEKEASEQVNSDDDDDDDDDDSELD